MKRDLFIMMSFAGFLLVGVLTRKAYAGYRTGEFIMEFWWTFPFVFLALFLPSFILRKEEVEDPEYRDEDFF